MAILFNNADGNTEQWVAGFKQYLPDMPLHVYPYEHVDEIEYAVIWNHPKGDLNRYPNLKAIMNLGAGADFLEADPSLPRVPVVRLLDPVVGINMAQYVLYWAMHFQRGFERYRHQQIQRDWSRFQVPQVADYAVAVLGLGLIGQDIAQYIARSGFNALGWNRSAKQIADVDCFHGPRGLSKLLSRAKVLVNCLPVNGQTEGMINAQLLSKLPQGSIFINVSRGAVVNESDLIDALDREQLAHAVLDTFAVEPLPEDSPLWRHPKIHITPHISGATYASTSARVVADNILRIENGETPFPIYPQFPY